MRFPGYGFRLHPESGGSNRMVLFFDDLHIVTCQSCNFFFGLLRTLFLDKFLLWKVLPVRCLRWIFQFAVFGCPPNPDSQVSNHVSQQLPVTLQSLVVVWSKQEFVRSASLEQQVCILLLFVVIYLLMFLSIHDCWSLWKE